MILISFVILGLGLAHVESAPPSTSKLTAKQLEHYNEPQLVPDSQNPNNFSEYDYLVSVASHNWVTAKDICETSNGPDWHLVAIESEEELQFLTVLLERFGENVNYWTSGLYVGSPTPRYLWEPTGEPLGSHIPWAPNHPQSISSYRAVLSHLSRWEYSVTSAQSSRIFRHICEKPRLTVPRPCYARNDLVVLLDSSGSISLNHYAIAKDFVARLIGAFSVTLENRVSLIVFSSNVVTTFRLTVPTNPDSLRTLVENAPYMGSGTHTSGAIDQAVVEYQTNNPRNVPRNLVVLTDGQSNNRTATIQSANAAKALGLRLFSVGIGNSVDPAELLVLAGGDQSRAFTTDDFEHLVALLYPVSRSVCP